MKNKSNSRCATLGTGSSGARSDGAGGERSACTKGARLTTDITLPSRYLVFSQGLLTLVFPNVLKANQNVNPEKSGRRVLRRAGRVYHPYRAEGVGEAELASDAAYLKRV